MVKRVTVKDIAKELGLSLGTINKVLNNKPGVSSTTRSRVLEAVDRLGYKVNRVAQGLARETLVIGIIIPEVWQEFFGYLKKGIDIELEKVSDYNINGIYYNVPDLYSKKETLEAFEQCYKDNVDAIIVCPAHESRYDEAIDILQDKKVPIFALGNEIHDSRRLCCIRIDAHMSGSLAAEYMSRMVKDGKYVAVFIGNKDMYDHKEKADGFVFEAEKRGMNVIGVYESHDDPNVAYYLTEKIIRERKDIGGIYVATANSAAVCKYIDENRIKGVYIVGTDVSPNTCEYMEKEIMHGIIFQDTITQGKVAVRTVIDHLVYKKAIESSFFITPQLLLKSNMKWYQHQYNDIIIESFDSYNHQE